MENPCFRFAEDAVATFRFAVRLFWGLTDPGPSILITAIVLKRPTRGISIHRVRTPLTLCGRPVAICLDGRPPLDTGRTGHCTGRTRRTPRVVSDISTRDRSANPQGGPGPQRDHIPPFSSLLRPPLCGVASTSEITLRVGSRLVPAHCHCYYCVPGIVLFTEQSLRPGAYKLASIACLSPRPFCTHER